MKLKLSIVIVLGLTLFACSNRQKDYSKKEHIRTDDTTELNSDEVISLENKTYIWPGNIVLTGLKQHRLISIYKTKFVYDKEKNRYKFYNNYDLDENYTIEHYFPGLDLLSGFTLTNFAHYNFGSEKNNLLFEKPVIIKSLYYPSPIQDSINHLPITRNYFLVSAYDEDTDKDTVLTRQDLRRIYSFNDSCTRKNLLLPKEYSVTRAQYDDMNDAIFIYAKYDANKNGKIEKEEPLHVFCVDLKNPQKGKRVY